MSEVEVNLSGPIFSGVAERVMEQFAREVERDVAAQAYAYVATNLNASIREPTPYYETQITSEPRGEGYLVHDRGVVYGPWLEGVGSRNGTTRFKGYASFRRARQRIVTEAPRLAQRLLPRFLGRIS